MYLSTVIIEHAVTDVLITADERNGMLSIISLLVGTKARQAMGFFRGATSGNRAALDEVAHVLTAYLDGRNVRLSDVPVALSSPTVFQKKILTAARSVPYGTTCSYAELARRAGHPGAVRAVASALRYNPIALLIPCHRIIRSDGSIGGYCGSQCGDDALLKRHLLELEAGACKK